MKHKFKIDTSLLILTIVALILAYIAWKQGGIEKVIEALKTGGNSLVQIIPLLIAAFITAGMIQVSIRKDTIKRWLGAESGFKGLLLACIGGALIPGGPYVYYPIAGALMKTGAGIGVLVAFVTAKNLWSVSRIPLEIALLGNELTINRYMITFIFPILLGFVAEILFGRFIEQIRRGVPE